MQKVTQQTIKTKRKINAFDGFVLAGALVNIAVILLIFGYWVMH